MAEPKFFIEGQWLTGSEIFEQLLSSGYDPTQAAETTSSILDTQYTGGGGSDSLLGKRGNDNLFNSYERTLYIPPSAKIGGVDPRLVDVARKAAAQFPYEVRVSPSGGHNARRGGTKNHPGGFALDFQIIDPKTGRMLGNYQDPSTFRTYEKFAQTMRQIQMQDYPELNDTFRFGGYFGGRYGFDQMHVDINPAYKGATSQGSWEYGLGRLKDGSYIRLPSKWRNAGSVGMGDVFGAKLAELGYEGPNAVARFQADYPDLAGNADGVLGPQTMKAIAQVSNQPISAQAARLLPPPSSPALGARVAAEMEVPPSFPGLEETAQLLEARGYSGPDAVMRFQADQMGLAGKGGVTGPDFFAALTNPREILPRERPDYSPPIEAKYGAEQFGPAPPSGIIPVTGQEQFGPNQPQPQTLGGSGEQFGGPMPRPRPEVPQAPGIPTPRTRPEDLGGPDQTTAQGYRRLRVGDRGDDVMSVQGQLTSLGIDPGQMDGIYGPKTARAVMEFQRSQEEAEPGSVGGVVDAIAGPWTQARLFDVTRNSGLGSLRDPGGVEGHTPSALEMGRTGWGQNLEGSPDFTQAGSKGVTLPGPIGTQMDKPFTGKAWGPEMWNTDPYSPAEIQQLHQKGGLGVTMRDPPRPDPGPFVAKPWGPEMWNTDPYGPTTQQMLDSELQGVGMTLGEATNKTQPSPLSPTQVIATLGGTGSSGLGPASGGDSGPGSESGGRGSNGPDYGSNEDSYRWHGPGGYNESFATTGWIN